MIDNKTILAIIPARGGSKRIPKKNLVDLNGKPLIQWTIEAAKNSQFVDEVVVSSDDSGILGLAESLGCSLLERPEKFSGDLASRASVIKHAVEAYMEQGKPFDYLLYLQPTSPLRGVKQIDEAVRFLRDSQADAVISVCELDHPIQWSGTLPENRNMDEFLANIDVHTRSQDLEKYYRLNGAIYLCDIPAFLKQGCVFLEENVYAYEMDRMLSVDIDHQEDLLVAKAFMDFRKSSQGVDDSDA